MASCCACVSAADTACCACWIVCAADSCDDADWPVAVAAFPCCEE